MIILKSQADIELAQRQMEEALKKSCNKQIRVQLGFQGGQEDCIINWSGDLGLWFHSRKLEGGTSGSLKVAIDRFWNVFGLSETLPRQNSMLSIVCEVNPPLQGLDRRVQGAYARDNTSQLLLLHRGKIGGGRRGIGGGLFWREYRGEVVEISDTKFAVVGHVSSPDFASQAKSFVSEVRRIKEREKVPPIEVIIDGSNVASDNLRRGEKPRLSNIRLATEYYKNRKRSYTVIVDASLRHVIDERESFQEAIDGVEFKQAPPQTPADRYILELALIHSSARIVSNDQFMEYRGLQKYQPIFSSPDRFIRFKIDSGRFISFEK